VFLPSRTVESTAMKTKINPFLLFSFIATLTCFSPAQSQSRTTSAVKDTVRLSYEDEINAWHSRRIAGLKRPFGWMSLVALDWLNEGKNTLSSIGTVVVSKGTILLHVLPDVHAKVRGATFTSGLLRTDKDKEGPDRVEVGTRALTIIGRGERYAVRMWDSTAETRTHFTGIERFPVNRQWRIEARWEPYASPKTIKIQSVIPGYSDDYKVHGVAVFSVGGKEYRLEPVDEGDQTLFFIFADKTNGKETYGAGRFLYADPSKDGKVIIDFNKAYNPPCAFTAYATCPLPPESNCLTLRVEAGEKKFGDH
jgi:uncharacterized protein (DUF1684 family)